jgi:Amidohydrolase family
MPKTMSTPLLLGLVALFVTVGAAAAEKPVVTKRPALAAFIDVNVIPMSRQEVRRHQTVLIDGDRISAMGPVAQLRVPPRALRIAGAGRYLVPGLIDMHVHMVRRPLDSDTEVWRFPNYRELNERFGLLFVANGVTSVRQLHAHPVGDELRARNTDDSWLGPAIYSTGPITDGDPPMWPIARILKTPADAQRAVADDKAAGYLAIKVYDNVSVPLYEAIVSAAAEAHLDVVGHVPRDVGLRRVIDAHQATIEHTDSFIDSLQPGNDPYVRPPPSLSWEDSVQHADLARLPAFADAMRLNGIWTCPTVVVVQMDATNAAQGDEMRYVPRETTAKMVARYAGLTPSYKDDLAFALNVVSVLHGHGAGLLLGTDTFKLNVVPGFSAQHELELFVEAGLSPFEALQTGTINAARALHEEEQFGTVDVGKRADLILLDADPLADVHNMAKRAGVMLRGHWYSKHELAARLARYASETS